MSLENRRKAAQEIWIICDVCCHYPIRQISGLAANACRSAKHESRRDQVELAATPADIGMLPVPTQSGIDLAIVAGDPTKIKEHSGKTYYTEEQEDNHCAS